MGKSRWPTTFRRLWRFLSSTETISNLVSITYILKIINACQDNVQHGTNCTNEWFRFFYSVITVVKFYQEMCSVPCRTDILRGASRVPDVRGAGTRDAPLRMSAGEAKTLFTWSGGPRPSGVSFFCFVSRRAWKQKKPTPLDRGPPLHVNRP